MFNHKLLLCFLKQQEIFVLLSCGNLNWQPTPVSLSGNSMDRGAWWAAVHGITKSHNSTHTWTEWKRCLLLFLLISCHAVNKKSGWPHGPESLYGAIRWSSLLTEFLLTPLTVWRGGLCSPGEGTLTAALRGVPNLCSRSFSRPAIITGWIQLHVGFANHLALFLKCLGSDKTKKDICQAPFPFIF